MEEDIACALLKAIELDMVGRDERVVVINTGNGLKDVAGAMKGVEMVGTKAYRVAPNLEALKQIMTD